MKHQRQQCCLWRNRCETKSATINLLNLVATAEKFFPIAMQNGFQTHQCWQAWKIFPRLKTLNVARTCADFLGQMFLRQSPLFPQRSDVFSEPCPMRTAFGFARWHHQMLSERRATKHEALHRAHFFSILGETKNPK
jgi:hypothetical protein